MAKKKNQDEPQKEVAESDESKNICEIEAADSTPDAALVPDSQQEQAALDGILRLVLKSTHTDFSHYRQTTILRRIARRVSLSGKNNYAEYLSVLEADAGEIEHLYTDLLLSHTEFFRDPQIFETLKETVFPNLVKHSTAKTPIRFWIAGCSTGEEVYSLAIALHEYLAEHKSGTTAQFFGTDLNGKNITTARLAIYPDKIRKVVSPQRLARYFDQTPDGLRVTKQIREMCVFAIQDVTQDPPFPSIDLVSCRNVLIYFDTAFQEIVMPLFHFALKPEGYLLLGSSETMGRFSELFAPVSEKNNLYLKRYSVSKPIYRFPSNPIASRLRADYKQVGGSTTAPLRSHNADIACQIDAALLDAFAPPCIVVDSSMQIRQFRGNTSQYLTPSPGEASLKLSKMTSDGLMPDIYVAIEEAKKKKGKVTKKNIVFRQNSESAIVDLSVIPVVDPSTGEGCFLIAFQKPVAPFTSYIPGTQPASQAGSAEEEREQLRHELQSTKGHLQSIIDEKDQINQEMWAANEEIQSTNEELQSVNEEMEAAKEELESSNEELIALNEEVRAKNIELKESEAKFRHLVRDMQAGVLVQGPSAEILMSNPKALELLGVSEDQLVGKTSFDPDWNVIHEDGSPFPGPTHPVPVAIATRQAVCNVIMGVYRPVSHDRIWLHVDAQPQLNADGTVLQVVCTFIDITERKNAEEALAKSELVHRSMTESSPMGMHLYELMTDGQLVFFGGNPAADKILGIDHSVLIGSTIETAFPSLVNTAIPDHYRQVAKTGVTWQDDQTTYKDNRIDGAFQVVAFRIGKNRMVATFMDITARKNAEDALRESEYFFKESQRAASVGSYKTDFVADAWESSEVLDLIFGIDKTYRRTIQGWLDLVYSDDQDTMNRYLQDEVIGKQKLFDKEYRIMRRSDKEVRWVYGRGKAEFDKNGNILSLIGTIQDITDRKKAEEALRKNSEQLSLFIRYSPAYCYIKKVTATESRVLYASENFKDMIGIPGSQMNGKSMEELYPPDFAAKMTADDIAVVTGGEVLSGDEEFGGRSYTTIKFPIVQGDTTLLAGYTLDITERKKAEEEIRLRESYLSAILENQPGLLWLKNPDGRFVAVNQNFSNSCGLSSPKEIVGKTDRDIWPRELAEKYMADDRDVLLSQKSRMVEELVLDKEELRWFETYKTPVKDSQGIPIGTTGYSRDITARKQAQKEHLEYEQQLQKSQKLESLGILAGGIAHDFNNLMGGIFGFIDLARSTTDLGKISTYLSRALGSMERARGLTRQLLTFAKGGAPVQKVVPLFPFIADTVHFALSGSNVSSSFAVAPDLRPCNIDQTQIGQAIDNIVINAKQAMADGGTIAVAARNVSFSAGSTGHATLAPGDYVQISITDTGTGIPPEIMPHIYDPFFTTKAGGHGLGLATCHSIINRHGGCIDVESVTGSGSTFRLYLPAAQKGIDESASPVISHTGSGTIIVMDDESVIRETYVIMLESMGHTVIVTENGADAIACFSIERKTGTSIAALIFDLTVPGGMGGLAAVSQIRKLDTDIPVFVASGYADDPVMMVPQKYGFTASISKPFIKADLAALLEKFLT